MMVMESADGKFLLRHKLSDVFTESGLIITGTCDYVGIQMALDGTNDVTFNIFDSLTASGDRLVPNNAVATTSSTNRLFLLANGPIACANGIYVSLVCAGTVYAQILYA